MALIMEATSRKQYYKILDTIESKAILYPYLIHIISVLYPYYIHILTFTVIEKYSNNHKIVNWCRHKQYMCIASGINPHCSKMDSNIFSTIVKNTNAIECSHFQANNLGRRLSLLAAILILIYFFMSVIQYYNNSLSG